MKRSTSSLASRVFSLAGVVAFGLACSDDTATPPDGSTGDRPAGDGAVNCTNRPPFETGSAEGAATPLTVPAGGVRAGRLAMADLPTDRTGLSTWKAGDYVLANERVALMIEAARPSSGYDPWGGMPIGVARMQSGRMSDPADFNEFIFGLGRYTVATDSVTVLRDGTQGQSAIIRASGPMRAIPFIEEFGRALAPTDYMDVRAAIDYMQANLEEPVTVASIAAALAVSPTYLGVLFRQHTGRSPSDRMERFFPGAGFLRTGEAASTPATPTVAWVDEGATGYAWQHPTSQFTSFLSVSGFDAFNTPPLTVAGCTQTRVHLGRLIIGGPGLDGLQQTLARRAGTRLREIRGTVSDAMSVGAMGVNVHATSPDRMTYYSRAATDSMGNFTLHVPEGQVAQLTASRQGDAMAAPVTVGANEMMATIRLMPTGTVRVLATENPSSQPLPVRVQLIPTGGTTLPTLPANFGEPAIHDGRMYEEFPTSGVAVMRAPPGQYRLVVSRGFEYELYDQPVTVTAGMAVNAAVALRRVVDTTNVMCGDFHIHTNRSPDSRDSARYKLASAAADGLEIAARSDHEFVAEFSPLIQEMGIDRWVYGLTSLELTTFVWGHFGVFPLQVNPAQPNGGAVNWAGRLPPAVFAEVRARPESPTIVVNHPRTAGLGFGYMSVADYNPATGMASRPEYWDDRFTAYEFFNDSSFEQNPENVRDWYSFLARGRRVAAVGSSDSHTISGGSPVGYPRTCLYLNTDTPAMATPNGIRDAVANGRSTVSGGVYLDVTASPGAGGTATAGPGQDLMGAGNEARVRVRVQAAPWVNLGTRTVTENGMPREVPSTVEVIVDGMVRQTITLDNSMRDPMNPVIRLQRDVMVPVAASGSWVIVAVHGGELVPVFPRRSACGVSNPIFLRR
jgi:AraC-like DNA-binding protein